MHLDSVHKLDSLAQSKSEVQLVSDEEKVATEFKMELKCVIVLTFPPRSCAGLRGWAAGEIVPKDEAESVATSSGRIPSALHCPSDATKHSIRVFPTEGA